MFIIKDDTVYAGLRSIFLQMPDLSNLEGEIEYGFHRQQQNFRCTVEVAIRILHILSASIW